MRESILSLAFGAFLTGAALGVMVGIIIGLALA